MTTQIGSPPGTPAEWTLLQTLSPAGVTTITSAALTAYTAYRVIFQLKEDVGATGNLLMQFNGDAGNNYTFYTSGGVTAATNCILLGAPTDAGGVDKKIGEAFITGKSNAVASGRIGVMLNDSYDSALCFGGFWVAGNAVQISTMTFLVSGGVRVITGKILIYGRSDI